MRKTLATINLIEDGIIYLDDVYQFIPGTVDVETVNYPFVKFKANVVRNSNSESSNFSKPKELLPSHNALIHRKCSALTTTNKEAMQRLSQGQDIKFSQL